MVRPGPLGSSEWAMECRCYEQTHVVRSSEELSLRPSLRIA